MIAPALVLTLSSLVTCPASALLRGQEGEEETVRLEEWPELEKSQRSAVDKDVQRLRKARTPEMAIEAHDALTAVGAAAGPTLLEALGKEKDEEARERITDVLERVTGAPHTRLLAEYFDAKSPVVRTWTMHRCAGSPDSGIRAAAEAAFERVRLAEEKGKTKGLGPEEPYVAALVVTSVGSVDGLDTLRARAEESWKNDGKDIRVASEAVRGAEATARLIPTLESGDRKKTVATLRLLAGCGSTEEAVPAVKPLLDSDDATIRIAAINALRGIVDGEAPLEKLSVFDSIEQAKAWKGRT